MKTLRRPMFRRGGEVGGGITSGMRSNFKEGTYREQFDEIMKKYSTPAVDPIAQLLIQGGLRGLSETGGGNTLANLARAFEPAVGQAFQSMEGQRAAEKQAALTGLEIDIDEQRRKEDIAREAKQRLDDQAFDLSKIDAQTAGKIKELERKYELEDQYGTTGATSNLQKDYSPQRAYEDLVSKRTDSRAGLAPFQKPNIEQAYPRATAEYDTYILRNLRKTDNALGQEIRANNFGFVPYDQKEGEFDINAMIPGGYYFYPPRKIFVVNEPPTDENEGGLFMINPYTFEKVRFQGN